MGSPLKVKQKKKETHRKKKIKDWIVQCGHFVYHVSYTNITYIYISCKVPYISEIKT